MFKIGDIIKSAHNGNIGIITKVFDDKTVEYKVTRPNGWYAVGEIRKCDFAHLILWKGKKHPLTNIFN